MATVELTGRQREALAELAEFPLVDALYGRRSRRFPLGGEIPDGLLAFRSRHEPPPLSDLERLLVLIDDAPGRRAGTTRSCATSATRRTWRTTPRAARPGRMFPSAAAFHTAEIFFTDDCGTYFFPTRDAGALVDPAVEEVTPELMLERHAGADPQALGPARPPAQTRAVHGGPQHVDRQRTRARCWSSRSPISPSTRSPTCASSPRTATASSTTCNHRPVPGMEQFRDLVDVDNPLPLTFLEQYSLTEATAELATRARSPGRAAAAGDGPGRLDVRRDRSTDDARRLR